MIRVITIIKVIIKIKIVGEVGEVGEIEKNQEQARTIVNMKFEKLVSAI